jgi:hypothetical protein
MRTKLAWVLGLLAAANGVFMLLATAAWYASVPGVPNTGPFNAHFIRDIGAAFLVAGGSLVWFARDARARPAALACAAFFVLHALVHLTDAITGRESIYQAVHAFRLSILVHCLRFGSRGPFENWQRRRKEMLKWLLKRRIDAFEKEYDYDASHMRYILDVSLVAALKFGRIKGLANYREDVPLDASFSAALTTTLAEDCGPCSQLVVTMGEREGVAPATIKAILAGDERAMTPEAALGYRFTQATLQHAPAADALRDEIVARWGHRALVSLVCGITAARMFPTLKYALGYGKSCSLIRVGGAQTEVSREAA